MSNEIEKYINEALGNGVSPDLVSKTFTPDIKSLVEDFMIENGRDDHRKLMPGILLEIQIKVDRYEGQPADNFPMVPVRQSLTWFRYCHNMSAKFEYNPISIKERKIDETFFRLLIGSSDDRKKYVDRESYFNFRNHAYESFAIKKAYKKRQPIEYEEFNQKTMDEFVRRHGIVLGQPYHDVKGCCSPRILPCPIYHLNL